MWRGEVRLGAGPHQLALVDPDVDELRRLPCLCNRPRSIKEADRAIALVAAAAANEEVAASSAVLPEELHGAVGAQQVIAASLESEDVDAGQFAGGALVHLEVNGDDLVLVVAWTQM